MVRAGSIVCDTVLGHSLCNGVWVAVYVQRSGQIVTAHKPRDSAGCHSKYCTLGTIARRTQSKCDLVWNPLSLTRSRHLLVGMIPFRFTARGLMLRHSQAGFSPIDPSRGHVRVLYVLYSSTLWRSGGIGASFMCMYSM